MQSQPSTLSPDDLASRLSGVTLEAPARRSKRPARVFHNLDSGSSDPMSQPIIPSDLPDPTSSFDASIAASLNGFVPSVADPISPKPSVPGQMPYGSGTAAAAAAAMASGREAPAQSQSGINGSGRVDPDQIPSVVAVRESNQEYYSSHVYPTMEKLCPPIAGTEYSSVDQGSSNPKFGRLTLCSVPQTADMLATTHLPLGLVLQPLASLNASEAEVPVLDFGESGPPRCNRCRAYINPFVQFADGGAKFVCNMCQFANTVPGDYYSPIDASGRRIDRDQRPELNLGSVDFIVPKQFSKSEPEPMRYIFAIDVSADAVNRSLPHLAAQAIRKALYGSDGLPQGCKIAIMTFDRTLHFYNLSVGINILILVVYIFNFSFLFRAIFCKRK